MINYYSNLFKTTNIPIDKILTYLDNIEVPMLNEKDKLVLDEFPTFEECKNAVLDMKGEKSPGLDGIPCEFYQCFWNIIGPIFYAALKEVFKQKEMSESQRLSVISLIYKKGEKQLLKNYRPISLTNTDYKIIACVLAKRLQKILANTINKNQTAYVKGRYIGENARLILDIFEYCDSENKNGILLFLDFEKAFDSVEWNFLFETLKKFNIGDQFLKWIEILYKNPKFKMKNNGWLSKTCSMTRGIRQGCPISA